jgi:peptidoglycan hydrolase CwlO-like protein
MLNRLTLLMSVLALIGSGTFAYKALSFAEVEDQLGAQIATLTASQEQLIAQRDQATADLNTAREEMSALKSSLERVTSERDEVNARFAAAREEMAALAKETATLRSTIPAKPTQPPSPPKRVSGDRLKRQPL